MDFKTAFDLMYKGAIVKNSKGLFLRFIEDRFFDGLSNYPCIEDWTHICNIGIDNLVRDTYEVVSVDEGLLDYLLSSIEHRIQDDAKFMELSIYAVVYQEAHQGIFKTDISEIEKIKDTPEFRELIRRALEESNVL